MLPGNPDLLGSFFDQGSMIPTDSKNLFIINDHKLSVVFRILLYLGCVFRPIEIVGHALLHLGHLAHLHGVFSLRFASSRHTIRA
jgi:hypothetical protein